MTITLATAASLGLILLVLSARVVMGRQAGRVSIGDGGDPDLLVRIRSHGNFTEYAPLALLLLFLAEQAYGTGGFVVAMGALLVIARIAHPIGMERPAPTAWRLIGTAGTLTAIGLLAIGLLVHLATR
jgi:hypothetical protein